MSVVEEGVRGAIPWAEQKAYETFKPQTVYRTEVYKPIALALNNPAVRFLQVYGPVGCGKTHAFNSVVKLTQRPIHQLQMARDVDVQLAEVPLTDNPVLFFKATEAIEAIDPAVFLYSVANALTEEKRPYTVAFETRNYVPGTQIPYSWWNGGSEEVYVGPMTKEDTEIHLGYIPKVVKLTTDEVCFLTGGWPVANVAVGERIARYCLIDALPANWNHEEVLPLLSQAARQAIFDYALPGLDEYHQRLVALLSLYDQINTSTIKTLCDTELSGITGLETPAKRHTYLFDRIGKIVAWSRGSYRIIEPFRGILQRHIGLFQPDLGERVKAVKLPPEPKAK